MTVLFAKKSKNIDIKTTDQKNVHFMVSITLTEPLCGSETASCCQVVPQITHLTSFPSPIASA